MQALNNQRLTATGMLCRGASDEPQWLLVNGVWALFLGDIPLYMYVRSAADVQACGMMATKLTASVMPSHRLADVWDSLARRCCW